MSRQEILKPKNLFRKISEYDLVFVVLENCLVFTKSGGRPKNIADFMPDYNLWYALKFCDPGKICIIENKDLRDDREFSGIPLQHYDTRMRFISIWLSQMTGIQEVKHAYSVKGNWRYLFGYPDDEELLGMMIRLTHSEGRKILFIDRPDEENKEYLGSMGIEYMTSTEFTNRYNKTQRKYEKK